MKCMCAQTRPRFILSSEGVFGGMEFEPMLTPREKSPLPENFPRGGSNPRRCGQRAQALPTELFRPPRLRFKPRFAHRDLSGSSLTNDLKTGTLVATLRGAWCYRVGTETVWPCQYAATGIASLICNFSLSVAACLGRSILEIH